MNVSGNYINEMKMIHAVRPSDAIPTNIFGDWIQPGMEPGTFLRLALCVVLVDGYATGFAWADGHGNLLGQSSTPAEAIRERMEVAASEEVGFGPCFFKPFGHAFGVHAADVR